MELNGMENILLGVDNTLNFNTKKKNITQILYVWKKQLHYVV